MLIAPEAISAIVTSVRIRSRYLRNSCPRCSAPHFADGAVEDSNGWGVALGVWFMRALLEHFARAKQQSAWHLDAERSCRLRVDDQVELFQLLDRQVGGLRTLQNPVDVARGAPM